MPHILALAGRHHLVLDEPAERGLYDRDERYFKRHINVGQYLAYRLDSWSPHICLHILGALVPCLFNPSSIVTLLIFFISYFLASIRTLPNNKNFLSNYFDVN
jgi:hypothetical protein